MVILHIASIKNDSFDGISVVVPHHINAQQEFAQVGLINIFNEQIKTVEHQFPYGENFCIEHLPKPFNLPDMVVFHDVYRPQYLKIYKQLRRKKIPYVILPHGCLSAEAQKKKWLKKKVANVLLFNRFINRAKAIQCLSQHEMDATHFGKYKFIGTNGIQMPEKKKTGFHADQTKFLYIGRLDAYHKGLDLMLEAIQIEHEFLKNNHCSFAIYGPDIEGRLAYLQSLVAEKNIGDLVSLNGPVVGEEKERLLLDADVFIQTSRFEGMPMGILEALSYGVPCLVTEGTTLGGLITTSCAGWSCETSEAAIAALLRRAVEEKDGFLQLSYEARKIAKNQFSWEKISNDCVTEYQKLTEGSYYD